MDGAELERAYGLLIAAADAVAAGAYEKIDLGALPLHPSSIGRLAAAFDSMVAAVASREISLRQARHDAVHRLVLAAEYRDSKTLEHIERMSRYAAMLARRLGLSAREVELIREAAAMHDVGKIGIPEHILQKPGRLDAQEWDVMRQHTEIGATILRDTISELLQAGEVIAMTHHERWDGSGYPNGLEGDSIPLLGRICAIADVFDALTSERPYKQAYSVDEALAMMVEGRGSHFDPAMLDIFLQSLDEVQRIRRQGR